MTTAELTQKMIAYANGNLHDISHFLKVWAYARTIGQQEGLDEHTQTVLETAALVHDIACPLCREKYGNTNGEHQQTEGMPLAADFLKNSGLPARDIARVVYLVGHHHTFTTVDGMDYQILLEADFLVNADESGYSEAAIRRAMKGIFKTRTGTALLRSVYRLS